MIAFFWPGNGERVKRWYHAVLGIGAAGACGYNSVAYVARRERHLGVNAILYLVIVLFEVLHVRHHK